MQSIQELLPSEVVSLHGKLRKEDYAKQPGGPKKT